MGWQIFIDGLEGELYYDVTSNATINRPNIWTKPFKYGMNGDGTLFYPYEQSLVGGVHRSINSDFARGPPGPQFLCSGGATGPPCVAFISGSWVMIRPLGPASIVGGALARTGRCGPLRHPSHPRAWGWRTASRSLARHLMKQINST